MREPSEFTARIVAVIPNEADPTLFLLDQDGQYPFVDYPGPGEHTYEGVFRQIGIKKLGVGSLSVARRLFEAEGPRDIVYEAKPISKDPTPESGYFWRAR